MAITSGAMKPHTAATQGISDAGPAAAAVAIHRSEKAIAAA